MSEVDQTNLDRTVKTIKLGDESKKKLRIKNLDYVLNIPIDISVEIGRTNYLIEELLKLGQGSVIELDMPTTEALRVMANGKLIGRAEVVVANESFGIRFTEICTKAERVESLK